MASLKPRVIVALDVSAPARARELVEVLGDSCDFYKVGSELFTSGGPEVVEDLVTTGKHVFLDLKLHDIPHTVLSAARSAAGLGVSLLTVHASGGRAMIEGAVEGAAGRAGVLAVTVLTSLDAPALAEAWGRDVPAVADEVVRLAGLAHSAGAQGIVCGGSEARRVRAEFAFSSAPMPPKNWFR